MSTQTYNLSNELTLHIPALKRAALAITRSTDRAEDLVQEALLRVWTKLRDDEIIDDLRAYLLTTLRNLARRPTRLAPVEAAPENITHDTATDRIALHEVIEVINHLPVDQANLLRMAVLGDKTIAELSADIGVSSGTIASRISRARAKLRHELNLSDEHPVEELLDH